MKHLLFFLVFLSLVANPAAGQPNSAASGFIPCSEFHVTRPLRDIARDFPVDENRPYRKHESDDRTHRVPQRFAFSPRDGRQYGNDSIQFQHRMGSVRGRAPIANWAGQSATGFRPMDPSGAAGPSHYVQMINSTTFKVYDKTTGAVLLTTTFGNLWSPATPNDGDPIVLYDKPADRWFLAQFGQTGNKMYIAVSTSGDPTGTYYTYTFSSPQFPDYLKFGVWTDGYYMTSNQTQKVFAFERTAMLAGNASARAVYTAFSPPQGTGFFVPLPGDASDGTLPSAGTPCPIFSYSDNGWGSGYSDAVNIYQMSVNWVPTTPTGTITLAANVPTAAFDATYDANWNDVSQPGTTQKLDGIGGVCMFRAQWKSWTGYNTILLNWAVKISATQRSIKWCELRQDQTSSAWSLYQEGIYTPDAATRWMGSIAMDNRGSIGIAYMKSDATSIYPGIYYTGRRVCDPLGTLPVTESTVVAGTGYQSGGNRVGDYSQLVLDPDGITFWYTSEYMGGTSGSTAARTRIFSFQIPPCDTTPIVTIAITGGSNPQCPGSAVTFTATPFNGGATPAYQWQVDGSNIGTNSATFTSSTLTAGQVVRCIMTSSIIGISGNPATSNTITMSTATVVTPAVTISQSAGSNPACSGTSLTFTANPVNGGSAPSYQWKVSGVNAGSNSNSFTSSSITNGQAISCVMTSNASCTSSATATSNIITLIINPSGNATASIAQTGGSNPLCSGNTATFTATVTGGTATAYQWKVDGVNAGTNAATFNTNNLTNGQVVTCSVTATASCPVLNTYIYGTGTSVNATNSDQGAAYPTYYGNGRQQYLIRASELTALGISAGSNFQSVAFNVTGAAAGNPATLNGYTIKIGTTVDTARTATFSTGPFTTVYGPQNYTPTLGVWNTHAFSAPFIWNGTSNIILDICFSNQVVGTAAYQNFYTTQSYNSSTFYQADGTTGAGACTQTSGSAVSRRPNMTFRTGLASNTSTTNGITMNVVPSPSISSFSPSAGPAGSLVTIYGNNLDNTNQVTFNGINANGFSILGPSQINAVAPAGGGGTVMVSSVNCGTASSSTTFSLNNTMNITMSVFFEGFYRGAGTMTGTLSGSLTDTAIVLLAAASAPYSILYSSTGIINTSGTGTFTFSGVPQGYAYYIIVRHRNSLETWSAAPVFFNSLSVNYDFSSSINSAYGNNLRYLDSGRYGIYSGDVNQDGTIDFTDQSSITSAAQAFLRGYLSTDVTGDLQIESADYSLIENNLQLNLTISRP